MNVETSGVRPNSRIGLPITIARPISAVKAMAHRASHDPDGDRRHAALHRSGVGDRNFLWFHPAVSAENFAIDWCCVDLPLQQDRRRDRGDIARCNDLGDACAISCGISVRVLDPESTGSTTRAFPSVSTS